MKDQLLYLAVVRYNNQVFVPPQVVSVSPLLGSLVISKDGICRVSCSYPAHNVRVVSTVSISSNSCSPANSLCRLLSLVSCSSISCSTISSRCAISCGLLTAFASCHCQVGRGELETRIAAQRISDIELARFVHPGKLEALQVFAPASLSSRQCRLSIQIGVRFVVGNQVEVIAQQVAAKYLECSNCS